MSCDAVERIEVETHSVACDGGGGVHGHPKVYLEMGADSEVQCPYCNCFYVLRKAATQDNG